MEEMNNMQDIEQTDIKHETIVETSAQNRCASQIAKSQLFSGVVDSISDDVGKIIFPFNTQLKGVRFSRNHVVVNNVKLINEVSLQNLFKVGMQVFFSLEHSEEKEDTSLKVAFVEVDDLSNGSHCTIEQLKYVHNKVFQGKIETLSDSSGTVTFELDSKSEVATFTYDCVSVSSKKLKDSSSVLLINQPVLITIVSYFGNSGCNYLALEVQTEFQSDVIIPDTADGVTLFNHSLLYGTIKNVTEISGTLSFLEDHVEKEAIFYRSCVLFNGLKFMKNIPLSSVLVAGMPVSFVVDNRSSNASVKVVEVLKEECTLISYSGLPGTITTLNALSGTISFHLNGEERKALFFRNSVVINNEKINKYISLSTVVQEGSHVILDVIIYEENNSNFLATSIYMLEPEDYSLCPVPYTLKCIDGQHFEGVILKVYDVFGIVEFNFNNKVERALFFRHNVLIDKERISKEICLTNVLHISMPVLIKVIYYTGQDFNFFASSVEVTQEKIPCSRSVSVFKPYDVQYCGTLQSLTESYGIITFLLDSTEEKAVMYRSNLYINDIRVYNNKSLLSLLDVGMTVNFTGIRQIGLADYYCKVTHLEVACLKKSSFLGQNFCGTIKKLTPVGGTISFQMVNEISEALFSIESVNIIGENVESEMSVTSVLKVSLPVSFKMGDTRVDKYYEATSVAVEVFSVANSQNSSSFVNMQDPSKVVSLPKSSNITYKSFECHGIIECLNSEYGVVTFKVNKIDGKAVFFKNSVRLCNMKIKSSVRITDVLNTGMQALLAIEKFKTKLRTVEFDFKASLTHIESTPECFQKIITMNETDKLVSGKVIRISKTCGIVTFTVNGKNENAIFFNDSIMINKKKQSKNISLLSIIKLGMNVSLRVKSHAKLNDCNFVATAVEIDCPNTVKGESSGPSNSSDLHGFIVALEAISGAVVFKKKNIQERAIFYKNSVHINDEKLKSGVSLLRVLKVGMCVLLQVQKFKDGTFNFQATCVKVKEDLKLFHNIFEVSLSKHISSGVGIVAEIISDNSALLEFQYDGQHKAIFELSNVFLDGKKCDDSQVLSTNVSTGDVYFFDATYRQNVDGGEYSITCVWYGQKPILPYLIEPYKSLVQDCKELPPLIHGIVTAIFPQKAALVDAGIYGMMLLFVGFLSVNNDMLPEEAWIQDYLNVGDRLILDMNKTVSRWYRFPLITCAYKVAIENVTSQSSDLPLMAMSFAEVLSPHRQIPYSSMPKSAQGNHAKNNSETDMLGHNIDGQVFTGIITSLESQCGTITIERYNRRETVYFTGSEVCIRGKKIGSNVPLLSVLRTGLFVTLKVVPCTEYVNFNFKALLVEVMKESLCLDDKSYSGTIESITSASGIIVFNIQKKTERALFRYRNVLVYGMKVPAVMVFLEVGMSVTFKVEPCVESGPCKYEATIVNPDVSDNFLAMHGWSPGQKIILPKDKTFSGSICHLTDICGKIAFKMHGASWKAVFSKNAVHVNNNQTIPSRESLLAVVKPGMDVDFTLEMYEGFFRANRINVFCNTSESSSDTKLLDVQEICKPLLPKAEADVELLEKEGKVTGFLSSCVGIIEYCIDGEKYDAWFTKDMIVGENVGSMFQKSFPCEGTVKFDGKLEFCIDKLKLRILSVWQYETSPNLRKRLRKFAFTLCSGTEYLGIVVEKLKADTFIVAIKHVPVLVTKKYFTEPAKFFSRFQSIQFGDEVTVLIQRRYSKKVWYDWFAYDAWRSSGPSDDIVQPEEGMNIIQPEKGMNLESQVLKGELVTVNRSSGILLNDSKKICFSSADASLFGVSLNDVDLTQLFIPGDVFCYTSDGSNATKVWYGSQQSETTFSKMFKFIDDRLVSSQLFVQLFERYRSQRLQIKHDDAILDSKEMGKSFPEVDNSVTGKSLDRTPGLQKPGRRKSLEPECDQHGSVDRSNAGALIKLGLLKDNENQKAFHEELQKVVLNACGDVKPNIGQQDTYFNKSKNFQKLLSDSQPPEDNKSLNQYPIELRREESHSNENVKSVFDVQTLGCHENQKVHCKLIPACPSVSGNESIDVSSKKHKNTVLSSNCILEPLSDLQNSELSKEHRKVADELPSNSCDNDESMQQIKIPPPNSRKDFGFLREHIAHSASSVLSEDVRQILLKFLSHTGQDSDSEVYHKLIIDQMLVTIDSSVKKCLSGHLLNEILSDKRSDINHILEVNSSSDLMIDSTAQLQRNVQRTSSSVNAISENIVPELKKKTVVNVDRETQTMSTGPVLFTQVFPN